MMLISAVLVIPAVLQNALWFE